MKAAVAHHPAQALPGAGPEREALREKGQFWTPLWLAKVMAAWVTELGPKTLFDPAVGPGTFFAGARAAGYTGQFAGYELHEASFLEGKRLGLSPADFERVVVGDFIRARLGGTFAAIVSNPPYIRHHRLSQVARTHGGRSTGGTDRDNPGTGVDRLLQLGDNVVAHSRQVGESR